MTISSVSSDAAARAVRRPSAGTGRAVASHRCIAPTELNTGRTFRPSGAATVTIDSSCVLSTSRPCAPIPWSPFSATRGISRRAVR